MASVPNENWLRVLIDELMLILVCSSDRYVFDARLRCVRPTGPPGWSSLRVRSGREKFTGASCCTSQLDLRGARNSELLVIYGTQ